MGNKKPRVIWCIEKPTDYIVHEKLGIVTGVMFRTKELARKYGRPVKFVEA